LEIDMTEIADNRILRVTRLLVYLIMGLVAFAGSVLALVCVVLPFYWTEAMAELNTAHPNLDPTTLLPTSAVGVRIGHTDTGSALDH
jgi:hypothetical protein